jgi:hypothetical protein
LKKSAEKRQQRKVEPNALPKFDRKSTGVKHITDQDSNPAALPAAPLAANLRTAISRHILFFDQQAATNFRMPTEGTKKYQISRGNALALELATPR